jgi:hypothetical protein
VERTKPMWQLSNRETGKAPANKQKLELRIGNKIISNPVEITEKLNTHFISTVEELVKQKSNGSVYNLKINHCPNSIFIYLLRAKEGSLLQVMMIYLRI